MHKRTNLHIEQAVSIILDSTPTLPVEEVDVYAAHHRVLAEELVAKMDQPRFRRAAVDGYGVAGGSVGPWIEAGSIEAGNSRNPEHPLGLQADQTVRIMTGAPVPPDIDRILRFEFCETSSNSSGEQLVTEIRKDSGGNIAEKGEEIGWGKSLLSPRYLEAQDVGIAASQGYARLPCYKRPQVSIISTGNELYSPYTETIPPYAIYDSNSSQLISLSQNFLAEASLYGILTDDFDTIKDGIENSMATSDMVICSGGVSMGDLDFVPKALTALGADILYHGLAVKPGKPSLFAKKGSTLFFGLPGNPVSTAAQFYLCVAPALLKMQGITYEPEVCKLPLAAPYVRKNADRQEFLPGILKDGVIHNVPYQGSGDISALAQADVLFSIPLGTTTLEAGDKVYARLLRSNNRLFENIGN